MQWLSAAPKAQAHPPLTRPPTQTYLVVSCHDGIERVSHRRVHADGCACQPVCAMHAMRGRRGVLRRCCLGCRPWLAAQAVGVAVWCSVQGARLRGGAYRHRRAVQLGAARDGTTAAGHRLIQGVACQREQHRMVSL